MRVSKPGENLYLKCLIYGPSGHGKTTFVATAQLDPRTKPALFIDFEGGEASLAGLDIDMTTIRSWPDYDEVYNELVSGKSKYKTVIVDSISETHIFALLDMLDKEAANRSDPDQLEQRDYGRVTIQMRRLLRGFRDLPMHVFFTALPKDWTEPRVGTIKKPALSGQLSDELVGMMGTSAYLALTSDEDTGEEKRALLLKNMAKFRVKTRTPWGATGIPDFIEEEEPREFAERGVTILLDALQFKGSGASKPVAKEKKRK